MQNSSTNQFGGAWTEEKLEILEGYLRAYTTALKNQNFHLTYVDAFAGTGYVAPDSGNESQGEPAWGDALDGPAREVLTGSTRRAIAVTDKPFDSFTFVEQNPDYARELRLMKAEYPDREITIEQADANAFLRMWCQQQNRTFGVPWRKHRAVIFLDPFATQVEWQTVEAIAETQSADLWILFPVSALARILPRNRQPNEAYASRLDRVYGGPEWRSLYQTRASRTGQPSLFPEEDQHSLIRDDHKAIADLYLQKMRAAFAQVAPQPKWFYNSKHTPLFAFMFAAANPKGAPIAVSIADHLLKKW